MTPFDQPPSGPPVALDPPTPSSPSSRRGRTALIAVVTVGLLAGGIAGVSQLASADSAAVAVGADEESSDESLVPAEESGEESGEPSDESSDESSDELEPEVKTDGEIVIDDGDGDPVVIDLGELDGDLGQLAECIGLPFALDEFEPGALPSGDLPIGDLDEFLDDLPFDLEALDELDLGELDLGEFGAFDVDGGTVTVTGPDGVSVVDLGEDGSVTITSEGGDVSVSTDGDATVTEMDDLFDDFAADFDIENLFDDFLGVVPGDGRTFPLPEGLPGGDPLDADAVEQCLDDLLGR